MPDRLHGVLQEVQDYLRDQVLVGVDDQVLRFHVDTDGYVRVVIVMAGQPREPFGELIDVE